MINLAEVGRRIRFLRVENGLRQVDLARAVGVSWPVVRKIEAGDRHVNLTLSLINRFAEVFDAPVEFLLGLDKEMMTVDGKIKYLSLVKKYADGTSRHNLRTRASMADIYGDN